MSDDRKWIKIFYADLIRDYPDVWADDSALAAFVRLLSTADPMWPTPPELPRSAKGRAVERLKAAGLLIALPMERFTIKGLDAERSTQRNAARNAAAVRWQSKGNADRTAKPMPTRPDQTNPDETDAREAENDPFDDPEHEALVWLAKHGCDIRPGNGYHQKLVAAVEVHGVNALIGMFDRLASAGTKQGDVKGFLFGAIDALNARGRPNLRAIEDEEARDEREEVRSRRIFEQMQTRRVELYRNTGKWEPEWGPKPNVDVLA